MLSNKELINCLSAIRDECKRTKKCEGCRLFDKTTNYCGIVSDYPKHWTVSVAKKKIF